jgi:hypothetical protein
MDSALRLLFYFQTEIFHSASTFDGPEGVVYVMYHWSFVGCGRSYLGYIRAFEPRIVLLLELYL